MSIESVTCPNCGATGIDLTAEYNKCEHCGSTLRTKDVLRLYYESCLHLIRTHMAARPDIVLDPFGPAMPYVQAMAAAPLEVRTEYISMVAAHNAAVKEARAQKAQRSKKRARRLLGIGLGIPLALLSLAILAWFIAACVENLRSPENTFEVATGVTMWVVILITGVPGLLLLWRAFGKGKGGKRNK